MRAAPPASRTARARAVVGGRAAVVGVALAAALGGCRRSSLPPRGEAPPVVLVEADAGAGDLAAAVDEHEPNDSVAAAQRLTLDERGRAAVKGTLAEGPRADQDVFSIEVPGASPDAGAPDADAGAPLPRRRLSIDVVPGPELPCLVQALDARGAVLATSTAGAGERCAIPNLASPPGVVLVRVRAGQKVAGAYALTLALTDLEPGDELEPNDQPTLATPLAVTAGGLDERAGFFGWRRDQDVWRVPADAVPPGGVISLELEGVEGVSASLVLADGAGRRLATARGGPGERVVLRDLGLPAPNAGALTDWLVIVAADRGSNADARYLLRVRTDVGEPGGEREPNDDPANARLAAEGATRGHLPAGDVDVFRVDPGRPVELDVTLVPPERLGLALELVTEGGKVLARALSGKQPARLPNVSTESAPAFLRVSAARKGAGDPDAPYQLEVRFQDPVPDGEREPNDALERPTTLALGASGISGLIGWPGDVDVLRVPAALGSTSEGAQVLVRGVGGLSLDVELLADDGKRLARFAVPPGGETRQPLPPAAGPGDLLVRVREKTGRLAAGNGERYRVELAR